MCHPLVPQLQEPVSSEPALKPMKEEGGQARVSRQLLRTESLHPGVIVHEYRRRARRV